MPIATASPYSDSTCITSAESAQRIAIDRGKGGEQDAPGDDGEADDQHLGKPEAERVETQRVCAEEPPDEEVVDLADHRGEDVDSREGAAEAQHARQLRAAGRARRAPRHQPPE